MGQIRREISALDQAPIIITDLVHLRKPSSDQLFLMWIKHFELILNRCVIINLIIMARQNTYFQIALELISFVPVRSISIIISTPWALFTIFKGLFFPQIQA